MKQIVVFSDDNRNTSIKTANEFLSTLAPSNVISVTYQQSTKKISNSYRFEYDVVIIYLDK